MAGTRRDALRLAWPWFLLSAAMICTITLWIRNDPLLCGCGLLICVTQVWVFLEAYRYGFQDGVAFANRVFWGPFATSRRLEEASQTLVSRRDEPRHGWASNLPESPKRRER